MNKDGGLDRSERQQLAMIAAREEHKLDYVEVIMANTVMVGCPGHFTLEELKVVVATLENTL